MPPAKKIPDNSVLDITGLFERLAVANAAPPPPPKPKPPLYIETFPGSGVMTYNYNYYYDEPPTLGETYGLKLGLTPRQVTWLDKFYPPANNAFLAVEPALQATLLLYLAVLPDLDRHLKNTGSTLAQEAKILEDRARSIAYQEGYYYQPEFRSGGKAGTDIYLAIFRLCENGLRSHFNYNRKGTKLFARKITKLEPEFDKRMGHFVQRLLPTLLAQVPPPGAETEVAFNEQSPTRWKLYFESLTALLPAKVPAFLKGLDQLLKANKQNPNREAIYFEAAKALGKLDPETTLKLYVQYLHDGNKWVHPQPKPLPKSLEKVLFPLPEHAQRFTMLVGLLQLNNDRKTALENVAKIYVRERKKIELDMSAVLTVRDQHAGTVELLNEYLRDEPAASPIASVTTATKKLVPAAAAKVAKVASATPAADESAAKTTAKTAAKTTAKSTPKSTTKSPKQPKSDGFGPVFTPGLALAAVQQAFLHLFKAPTFALPQAQAEAFAKAHGTFRNQLVDGLNDACYELLDDVLIEEDGPDYTIYAPHYQKITA